jgi:hypothetical protein
MIINYFGDRCMTTIWMTGTLYMHMHDRYKPVYVNKKYAFDKYSDDRYVDENIRRTGMQMARTTVKCKIHCWVRM